MGAKLSVSVNEWKLNTSQVIQRIIDEHAAKTGYIYVPGKWIKKDE